MTTPDILSDSIMLILFLVLLTGVAFPFSGFIVRVFDGSLSRGIPGQIEKAIY